MKSPGRRRRAQLWTLTHQLDRLAVGNTGLGCRDAWDAVLPERTKRQRHEGARQRPFLKAMTLGTNAEPTTADLESLEERAKAVLEAYTSALNPVVVEFAGSPKAGKSTTIDIVGHFFKRMKYKVWAPTEGASKRTPYHLKRDLVAYNTWTLNYAISELLVSYHNVDQQHLILMDRGPFDSLAWMGLLVERKDLDKDDFKTIEQFALHPRWIGLIDRLYLFTCDPATSLRRETESKLTTEAGVAMNPKMLDLLIAQYKQLETKLGHYPVHPVATGEHTTPKQTSYRVACDLMDIFEARVNAD